MEEFQQIPNEHQLWVNFSSLAEGNLFTQLTELITEMYKNACDEEDEFLDDDYNFTLASDYEWRIGIYFTLLEKMKAEMHVPWLDQEEVVKLHHWDIVPKSTKIECNSASLKLSRRESLPLGPSPITWTVSDLSKAASLLDNPPKPTEFEDEQEMRRVYTLIYDTFRYKSILIQALNDISFYQLHPNIQDMNPRVWLLFFDLYHRNFQKREPAVVETSIRLFEKSNIIMIEMALWEQRVKLAAAIARLRIKNSALRLSELLPKHLRDNRLSRLGTTTPVTCWINPYKTKSEEEVTKTLEKVLNLTIVDEATELTPQTYKRDALVPCFVTFHASQRTALAQSSLVVKHKLIVQDRSFCLGPATFGKIICDLELAGSVIQSHVNSPRTTAYLAMILSKNSKIKNLLVFSAGHRKDEYENYFQDLGMKNISIYSENLIELPPDSNCLDRVIAVFATPPNSYSAVSDPIDLVCSRGGDLSMLEALTESQLTDEGRERVAKILDEQRKTLRFAMSRPQIQLVLYETHSELEMENDGMVHKTIKEINKMATLKHATLQGKIRIPTIQSELVIKEINNNMDSEDVMGKISKSNAPSAKSLLEPPEPFDTIYKDIIVPNCDLFDKPTIPDLCPNSDSCMKFEKEGCYLALLQRKEVTRLDNKYMIMMAESRGLFSDSSASGPQKPQRGSRMKRQEKRSASPSLTKTQKKTKNVDITRIAAATHASLGHTTAKVTPDKFVCPKYHHYPVDENQPLTKAMELLNNAAKDLNEINDHWKNYKSQSARDAFRIDPPPRLYKLNHPTTPVDLPHLMALEFLTNSEDYLKSLISSRPACTKTRPPSYGWKFHLENHLNQNIVEEIEQEIEEEYDDFVEDVVSLPKDKRCSSAIDDNTRKASSTTATPRKRCSR